MVTHARLPSCKCFYGSDLERYPRNTLKVSEMVEVEENGQVVDRPEKASQPRAQIWSGVKENKNKKVVKVINIERNFNFRPYTLPLMASSTYNFTLTLKEAQHNCRMMRCL